MEAADADDAEVMSIAPTRAASERSQASNGSVSCVCAHLPPGEVPCGAIGCRGSSSAAEQQRETPQTPQLPLRAPPQAPPLGPPPLTPFQLTQAPQLARAMAQQLPVQVQALPQYRSLSSAAMPQALRQAHVIAPHPFCSASAVAAATAVDKQRLCVACEACHDRKLKCRMPENGDPCDACKLKDRVCEARVGRKRGRPRLARPFLPGMECLLIT